MVVMVATFAVIVGVVLLLALFKGGSHSLDAELRRYEYEEQMGALQSRSELSPPERAPAAPSYFPAEKAFYSEHIGDAEQASGRRSANLKTPA